jgi:hypothetical protein
MHLAYRAVQPPVARLLKEAGQPKSGRGAARLPLQLLPGSFVDSLHASHAGEPHRPYLEAGRFAWPKWHRAQLTREARRKDYPAGFCRL